MPIGRHAAIAAFVVVAGSVSCGPDQTDTAAPENIKVRTGALTVNSWTFVGPNGCSANSANPSSLWSGTVLDIDWVSAAGVFRLASSAGGVFQWGIGGGGWGRMSSSLKPAGSPPQPAEGLAFSAVASKPSATNIALAGSGDHGSNAYPGYMLAGSGIWRTADGGTTWSNVLSKTLTGTVVYRIVWNKLATLSYVHAVTTNGYFRSTDDGQTWTQLTTSMATDIAINPNNDAMILIGVPGTGVRQSVNSGQTWTTILSAPTFGRTVLSYAPNAVIYAAAAGTVNGMALWKSNNAGANWSQLSLGGSRFGQCDRDIAVATDPTGGVVLIGCDETMQSPSGGAPGTWADVTTGNMDFFGDVHVMKFVSASTVVVGDDHGFHYSNNQGAPGTWHANSNIIPIDNVMNFDVGLNAPNTFWSTAWDNGLKVSTDGGATCRGFINTLQPDEVDVMTDPADANKALGTDPFGNRFRTTDTGNNWSFSFSGLPAPIGWTKFHHDQVPSVYVYTQGGKGMYRSTGTGVNFGANWTKYPNASTPDFPDQVFDFKASRYDSSIDGSIIYAYFSTSNPMKMAVLDPAVSTTTWTDITNAPGIPAGVSGGFTVSDSAVGTAFMASSNRIFKTTNRGQNWSEITGNLPTSVLVTGIVENPTNSSIIYVSTDRAIYKTTNAGPTSTWAIWINGIPPGGPITANLIGKNYPSPGVFKVFVGIWGMGIWSRDGSGDDP